MTKKKQTTTLLGSKQWVAVTVLMALLFVFAFGVYAADSAWNSEQANVNVRSRL